MHRIRSRGGTLLLAVALSAPASASAVEVHAAPTAQQAAGTITGRVTDAATGRAVERVSVTVAGTALSAVTGQNGNFILTGVPNGTHRVRARVLGYAEMEKSVTVAEGGVAQVDFALAT